MQTEIPDPAPERYVHSATPATGIWVVAPMPIERFGERFLAISATTNTIRTGSRRRGLPRASADPQTTTKTEEVSK